MLEFYEWHVVRKKASCTAGEVSLPHGSDVLEASSSRDHEREDFLRRRVRTYYRKMSNEMQNESSALTRSIQMPCHFLNLVVFSVPTGMVNSVRIRNTNSCLEKLVFDTFLLERWEFASGSQTQLETDTCEKFLNSLDAACHWIYTEYLEI
jgi:hypothetical protein